MTTENPDFDEKISVVKTKCRANGRSPSALTFILLTDAESRDNGAVSLDVNLDKVVEERSALTDHLEEAASGVMILLVDLEVLGQVVDSLGEKSDLNFGRTCVTLMSRVFLHDSKLFFFQHNFHPF